MLNLHTPKAYRGFESLPLRQRFDPGAAPRRPRCSRRDGRAAEGTRLESACTSKGYRGFESHSLRHPVCRCRDFAPATRDHPRNSRAFAGSWERGTAESEPETASSGPIAGSWSRLSLLPSLAVRIRFRFAPQGILEVRIPFAPPPGLQSQRLIALERDPSARFPRFRGIPDVRRMRVEPETPGEARPTDPKPLIVSAADFGGSLRQRRCPPDLIHAPATAPHLALPGSRLSFSVTISDRRDRHPQV